MVLTHEQLTLLTHEQLTLLRTNIKVNKAVSLYSAYSNAYIAKCVLRVQVLNITVLYSGTLYTVYCIQSISLLVYCIQSISLLYTVY